MDMNPKIASQGRPFEISRRPSSPKEAAFLQKFDSKHQNINSIELGKASQEKKKALSTCPRSQYLGRANFVAVDHFESNVGIRNLELGLLRQAEAEPRPVSTDRRLPDIK